MASLNRSLFSSVVSFSPGLNVLAFFWFVSIKVADAGAGDCVKVVAAAVAAARGNWKRKDLLLSLLLLLLLLLLISLLDACSADDETETDALLLLIVVCLVEAMPNVSPDTA